MSSQFGRSAVAVWSQCRRSFGCSAVAVLSQFGRMFGRSFLLSLVYFPMAALRTVYVFVSFVIVLFFILAWALSHCPWLLWGARDV